MRIQFPVWFPLFVTVPKYPQCHTRYQVNGSKMKVRPLSERFKEGRKLICPAKDKDGEVCGRTGRISYFIYFGG